MDIIPINPAPQQGSPLHPDGLQTGSAETGFGEVLGQAIPQTDAAGAAVKKDKPQVSSFRHSSPLKPEERSESPINHFSVPDSDQKPQVNNVRGGIEFLSPEQNLHDNKNDQLSALTTPDEYLLEGGAIGSINTNVFQYRDSFPDSKTSAINNQEQNHNLSTQQIRALPQSPSANQAGNEVQELPSANLQPEGASGFQVSGEMQAHKTPLALNSTAAAFSIRSTESVSITVEKTFIETGIGGPTLYPGYNKAGSSFPHSSQPGSQLGLQARLLSDIDLETPGSGRTISDSTHSSAVVKGHPEITFTGQASNGGQSSIMLGELQKLINQNNDQLNIDVSFETRMTSRKSVGYLVRPAILQNPESQMSSNELLTKTNEATAATVLNSTEMQQLSSREPLRSPVADSIQQQGFSSKVTGQEKSLENNNQMMQQNSNPQENSTLPQQNTAAAQSSSTGSSEQTANSAFTSQFHETGSSQSAEAVKPGVSLSPHLTLVHDQEIINQIVERFSAQSRLQTSRLSLQLNPAELGELKIEIIVKGDVLKANLYAQSNKAAEIIDKNLHRLKEILESQGITVEDLNVLFQSDNIDDFTSQHGQLFQDRTQLLKGQPKRPASSNFEIEDTLLAETNDQSGVNLTI